MESHDVAPAEPPLKSMSVWGLVGWFCGVVVLASVIACVVMAAVRSVGLSVIEVTSLPGTVEPRDHGLPFVKQKEALPDYEIVLTRKDGDKVLLGCKPDHSAADGLKWQLPELESVADIAAVRLNEQDKLVSDAVAEVHIVADTVEDDGYRFRFTTERSIKIGIASFFGTPIGKAITGALTLAILLLVLRAIGWPRRSAE